ncbi:DUF7261 family protein [Natrarchaeobius oligotrophus]|uniref:Uncharacterized protein n=1 Tax=Natrarchaeobius chitinivorans TaxID=1679083 RepID=A0A3N6PTZ2_NATCH|nr:hypothetical protein [Natrarchaeobius chitinivorans]RQH03186.1 hypothetical protein EA472_00935 [Natrarchaeobius chitinivorans]
MADVNASETRNRGRRRGQLLLITGLMLAITLVFLAVLLNGVIYAENLGTRGSDIGGHETVRFETAAADAGERFVVATNRDADPHADHADLVDRVDAAVADWDDQSRQHLVRDGSYSRVSLADAEDGARIHQSDSGPFESANDEGNWTVVENGDVRNASMRVDDVDGTFRLTVTTAASTWNLTVEDAGDVEVAAELDGADVAECSVSQPPFEIDFVDGTVDGDRCGGEPMVFAGGLEGPYETVALVGGDELEGAYDLTTNDTAPLSSSEFEDPGGDSPIAESELYSVDLSLTHETDRIDYQSTVTVTPNTHYGR